MSSVNVTLLVSIDPAANDTEFTGKAVDIPSEVNVFISSTVRRDLRAGSCPTQPFIADRGGHTEVQRGGKEGLRERIQAKYSQGYLCRPGQLNPLTIGTLTV